MVSTLLLTIFAVKTYSLESSGAQQAEQRERREGLERIRNEIFNAGVHINSVTKEINKIKKEKTRIQNEIDFVITDIEKVIEHYFGIGIELRAWKREKGFEDIVREEVEQIYNDVVAVREKMSELKKSVKVDTINTIESWIEEFKEIRVKHEELQEWLYEVGDPIKSSRNYE